MFKRHADLRRHVEVHSGGTAMAAMLGVLETCPARLVIDHFDQPDAQLSLACPGDQALLHIAENNPVYDEPATPYRVSEGGAPSR